MRYGYQLFVGPMCWSGSMDAAPMGGLGGYIAEAVRIRNELMGTIYQGEYLDKRGVRVDSEGGDLRYNTHRNAATGKRACVITNSGEAPGVATVAFEGGEEGGAAGGAADAVAGGVIGGLTVRAPFAEAVKGGNPIKITIPPQRFAVVSED